MKRRTLRVECVHLYGGTKARFLGITLHHGCNGSTYGELGLDMFFRLSLGFWWYEVIYRSSWKEINESEGT